MQKCNPQSAEEKLCRYASRIRCATTPKSSVLMNINDLTLEQLLHQLNEMIYQRIV